MTRDSRPSRRPTGPRRAGSRPPGPRHRGAPERGPRERDGELSRIAGLSAVSALFAAAPQRVERLFFDARAKPHVAAFCTAMAAAHRPYRQVEGEELARIAGTPMHGGVVALAQPLPVADFDVQEAERWARSERLLLVLDGVGNPHNLGAIVRTAAFFGVRRLILSDNPSQAAPSDASYRVAEGGFEHVAVYRARSLPRVLKRLQAAYRVIGTAATGGVAPAALKSPRRPAVLVLGNEEHGLSAATLGGCDQVITLPGSGAVQSLNVAASAAICISALVSG